MVFTHRLDDENKIMTDYGGLAGLRKKVVAEIMKPWKQDKRRE